MKTGASFSRGTSRQDYQTPVDFLVAVGKRFGPLSVDLAARFDNTVAPQFIGPELDSLTEQWHKRKGLLWLNPPFDKISPWACKCANESKLGARILFLVPASVGSNWFAEHVHNHAHVLLLNGRLSFDGVAPFPKDCILACYGFHDLKPGYDVWRWK